MGHTIHQLCINLMTDPSGCFTRRSLLLSRMFTVIYRHIPTDHAVYQFICLTDTVRYLAHDHFSAIETIHRNLCISRYNNTIRICNLLCGQHILCSSGASGLYLHKAVSCFRCLLNTFRSHVSMRDTGWTSGNCKNLHLLLFCRCFLTATKLFTQIRSFFICFINNLHKFIYGRCVF